MPLCTVGGGNDAALIADSLRNSSIWEDNKSGSWNEFRLTISVQYLKARPPGEYKTIK